MAVRGIFFLALGWLLQATDTLAAQAPARFGSNSSAQRMGRIDTEISDESAGRECLPVEQIPIRRDLTDEDLKALNSICWDEEAAALAEHADEEGNMELFLGKSPRNGVPDGVDCTRVLWCDDASICTEVCARGSVRVDDWQRHAISLQVQLAHRLPLCYAVLPGTHNTGISLAEGYGNRDAYFRKYLKWIKFIDKGGDDLETNNQWLSLTDQLNLGVRALELDTHWVIGHLRIAHCGGLHVPLFNDLIRAMNLLAMLMGHKVRWDTETVGCSPSLSSIPAEAQRTLVDALQEIKDWMDKPENAEEFLILYFDDQHDLQRWGKVPVLLEDLLKVFPRTWIVSPIDHKVEVMMHGPRFAQWPSIDELKLKGKRLLLVSGEDYGSTMESLVFPRELCGWTEPHVRDVGGPPSCKVPLVQAQAGRWLRVGSCEIQYGPLNCGFHLGINSPVLDTQHLRNMSACSINLPCPDRLTPQRAQGFVWSWAPGYPFSSSGQPRGEQAVLAAEDGRWYLLPTSAAAAASRRLRQEESLPPQQAAVLARLQAGAPLPLLCRNSSAPLEAGDWLLWEVPGGGDGACPAGYMWDVPYHGMDNFNAQQLLLAQRRPAARLPLHPPRFHAPAAYTSAPVAPS